MNASNFLDKFKANNYLTQDQWNKILPRLGSVGAIFLNNRHDIKYLPDKLYCWSSLSLRGTKIEKLPDNLKLEYGSLYINDIIMEIPDTLRLIGRIYVPNDKIKYFEEKYGDKYKIYGYV